MSVEDISAPNSNFDRATDSPLNSPYEIQPQQPSDLAAIEAEIRRLVNLRAKLLAAQGIPQSARARTSGPILAPG